MSIKNVPVVFVHADIIALTAARDLAPYKIRLFALDHARGIATYSRFVDHIQVHDYRAEPEKFISQLVNLSQHIGLRAPIFPTSDAVLEFLISNKHELSRYFIMPWDENVIARITDKWNLAYHARRCGVPIPRTILVRTPEHLRSQLSTISYPAIIKPVSSKDWSGEMSRKTGIRKVAKVHNPPELMDVYERIKIFEPRALIQEFIPGEDTNIFVFASLFDGEEGIASFVGRKILQHPEGITAVVEPVDCPELKRLSVPLLKELGYSGLSEIEFKKDADTGEFKLIEMNARHWVWHQLGAANGANITWLYYNYLLNKPVPSVFPKRKTVKWVDDSKIITLLIDILYGKSTMTIKQLSAMLRGPTHKAIFSVLDPWPFVVTVWSILSEPVSRRIRQWFSQAS